MNTKSLQLDPVDRPRLTLAIYWICWKTVLLLVALSSPGNGYDTSTAVLFAQYDQLSSYTHLVQHALQKLVRWDAVYFTQIAHRGTRFEQEWAFGWGFARLLNLGGRGLRSLGFPGSPSNNVVAGIFIAHLSHFLSVLVLFELSRIVHPAISSPRRDKFSFLAAAFHIISPAGIFLSAPYAESLFSLLNFTGMYLYAAAQSNNSPLMQWNRDALTLAAGLSFGLGTTVRSNGLLSGLIFMIDAFQNARSILYTSNFHVHLRNLCVTVMAGILLGLGTIVPQYLAYMEYCLNSDGDFRPWCVTAIPSIYAGVQKHYWGVGFLKYWTLSNLPLFLLAAPMLYIMTRSAMWAWNWHYTVSSTHPGKHRNRNGAATMDGEATPSATATGDVVRNLLIPQLALAILALTSYHVQIITRLSSGYPVWYWWLACLTLDDQNIRRFGRTWRSARIVSGWMIGYAMIQAGLFASFLPPA